MLFILLKIQPRWLSGIAFTSHAGDRVRFPVAKDLRFKIGTIVNGPRRWPLQTDDLCHSRCGTLKNTHCWMAISVEFKLWNPSPSHMTYPYDWVKNSRVEPKTTKTKQKSSVKLILSGHLVSCSSRIRLYLLKSLDVFSYFFCRNLCSLRVSIKHSLATVFQRAKQLRKQMKRWEQAYIIV